MIKNLTFAFGLLGLLSLASCAKDYSCDCTVDLGSGDTTISYLYENAKKGDAEEACTSSQTAFNTVDATATCSLNN